MFIHDPVIQLYYHLKMTELWILKSQYLPLFFISNFLLAQGMSVNALNLNNT